MLAMSVLKHYCSRQDHDGAGDNTHDKLAQNSGEQKEYLESSGEF